MEPTRISEVFFSIENPAIYAIIFVILLLIVVLQIKRNYIIPLERQNRILENENKKLKKLLKEL